MNGKRAVACLVAALALGAGTPLRAQTSGPAKNAVQPAAPVQVDFFANILQTIPVSPTAAGLPPLPAQVLSTARCIVGTADGVAPGTSVPIRFVGNVLCIDAGPDGNFQSFACGPDCPGPSVPVVEGVTLRKIEPRIPKCPDVFPGLDIVMSPNNGGIRTFWPLKLTPCGTEFILTLEVALVQPPGQTQRQAPFQLRVRNYHFTVTVTPDTLGWVVEALHNEPLGVCEVPCITDEGLFTLLLQQADTIRVKGTPVETAIEHLEAAQKLGSQTQVKAALQELSQLAATLRDLNGGLDVMEATIVQNATFLTSTAQVTRDAGGSITGINPCGAAFPAGLPGNFTIATLGFGIVDTLENPCACKLIADLFCLKQRLIGSDP